MQKETDNTDYQEQEVDCPVCGSCGETGCCKLKYFIINHVKGKTNCKYESIYVDELLETLEYYWNDDSEKRSYPQPH